MWSYEILGIDKARAVFFDWDGTLVDSFGFLHAAHNHVRGKLDLEPFSLEIFSTYFGQPREKLYTLLYGDRQAEARLFFERFVLDNHKDDLKPFECAKEILEWFKDQNIICGVVTNKKGDLVRAEIAHYGWDHLIDVVVGAGEAGEDKPSAKPLLKAIKDADLNDQHIEHIWFVGDTDNDLLCADAVGAKAILIVDHDKYTTLSAEHKVEKHFEDCKSFYDFLLQSAPNSLKAINE